MGKFTFLLILHYSISTGKSQPFIYYKNGDMTRNHKQSNLSYLASFFMFDNA